MIKFRLYFPLKSKKGSQNERRFDFVAKLIGGMILT